MREIKLPRGLVALVDDEDYEGLSRWKWNIVRKRGHAWRVRRVQKIDGKQVRVYMHRQIMGFPKGQVDHIDGNPLNNCRANLRLATTSQNAANRPKRKCTGRHPSPFKGVFRDKNRWVAVVRFQGVKVVAGRFDCDEQAGRAYDRVARNLHGEFARLNFPDEVA